jgi:hypothetical protein
MTSESIETDLAKNYDLSQRWPDLDIIKSFCEFLIIYHRLSKARIKKLGEPAISLRSGYGTICKWIQESVVKSPESCSGTNNSQKAEHIVVRSLVLNLKESYGHNWLQSVASLLGMLMHFSIDRKRSNLLANHRRPQKRFSTYPTSPAVARLVGDAIVTYLLKEPVPAICHRSVDAESYADRALNFRILDPAMESGQLLLEVALASIRYVHRKHSPHSRTARFLTRAILEKLCSDCLWGIDRNELATRAVSLLFSLLGAELGIQQLAPAHLLTADAFKYYNQGLVSHFDGIVNNPPWGEVLSPIERKRLRNQFSILQYRSDTYVAFSELAIRCLRPGGIFALILPSQVVAARNTARLREIFLANTEIDQMILLPRSAFADATVRGLVFLGRSQSTPTSNGCHVTIYPIVKKFNVISPARSFTVSHAALRDIYQDSWWPLLNANNSLRFNAQVVRLEEVATVTCGVQVYQKGRGIPPQTGEVVKKRPFTLTKPANGAVPAIRGRDVHDFHLNNPQQFIKFGKWLARVGDHNSLRRSKRIFVRELFRRDGKLTAAVARNGYIPLHGVLAVVPKLIDAYTLVGILNSTEAAEYVRTHAASFTKVDFQKITVNELRQMPIPIVFIEPTHRAALGLSPTTEQEVSLYERLITMAQRLSQIASLDDSEAQGLRAELDTVVSIMYNPKKKAGSV